MDFLKLEILVLLSSSFLFAANTGKVAVTDTGTVASLNALVASKTGQNVTYQITRPCTVATNLDIPKTFRINGIINNSWVYVNPGVTLTIRNCTENLPDSCLMGSGNVVFDACATSFFDTRWVGSSALSYSWNGCNGDTVRFTSFQASTAGIEAANITSGYFDSLYASQKIGADSIYARASRTNKLYVSDSIVGDLKISGGSLYAYLQMGTSVSSSIKSSTASARWYSNAKLYGPSLVNAYAGRSSAIDMTDNTMMFMSTPYIAAGTSINSQLVSLCKIDTSNGSYLRGGIAIGKTTLTSGYKLDVNGKILADDTIVAPYFKGSIINGSELKLRIPGGADYARIYAQSATPGGNNSIWIDSLVAAQTFVFSNDKITGSSSEDTMFEIDRILGCYQISGGNQWYDNLYGNSNSYIDNFKSVSADSGHFRALLVDTRVDSAKSAERADWADEAYYSQTAGEAEYAQQLYLDGNVYVTSLDSVKINGASGINISTVGNVDIAGSSVNVSGTITIASPHITNKSIIDSTEVEHIKLGGIVLTENVRNTAGVVDMTSSTMRDKTVLILQGSGNWDILAQTGTLVYVESNATGVYVNATTGQNGSQVLIPNGYSAMMLCRLYTGSVSNWNIWVSEY